MRVTVRVGFIGSAHSVARIEAAEAQLPGIALRSYPYTDPHDTALQYRLAAQENDVVCFAGTISHYHRDRSIDGDIPVLVGRFSDYTLVASLLAATSGAVVSPPPALADISIDMPNPDVAAAVARDTGVRLQPSQVTDYRWVYESRFSRPVDVDELVRFHERRATEFGARFAITSVHAVYDRLCATGRPAMFMIDSLQHDLDLIRTAQQRVSVQRLEGALLAVVYVTTSTPAATEPSAAEPRARVSRILAQFATPVQHRLGSWQRDGLDMFYTTRGELDERLPAITEAMLGDAAAGPPCDATRAVSLGVGVGRHLYEAEDRALQALRLASASTNSAAYLVDEDARVHGLLGSADEPVREARHTEPWLIELAGTAGMQARTVTRLLAFLATRDFAPFTAAEWAAASQTSPRTAERAVRKLLDAGALRVAGQEQPLDAGRPRTVYALSDELERSARQQRSAGEAPRPNTGLHARGADA